MNLVGKNQLEHTKKTNSFRPIYFTENIKYKLLLLSNIYKILGGFK